VVPSLFFLHLINSGRLIHVSWTKKVSVTLLQCGDCKSPGLIMRQSGPPLSPSMQITIWSSFGDSGVSLETPKSPKTDHMLLCSLVLETVVAPPLIVVVVYHCQSIFCCFFIMLFLSVMYNPFFLHFYVDYSLHLSSIFVMTSFSVCAPTD
jgi:hypothetical protein